MQRPRPSRRGPVGISCATRSTQANHLGPPDGGFGFRFVEAAHGATFRLLAENVNGTAVR